MVRTRNLLRISSFLVVITGPPGAGKTTLCPRLASALGAIPLGRELMSEAIFDAWSPHHPLLDDPAFFDSLFDRSAPDVPRLDERLAAWNIFMRVIERVVPLHPMVVESPFNQLVWRSRFTEMVATLEVPTVEVVLTAPHDLLLSRVADRASQAGAHPIKARFSLDPARRILEHPYEPVLPPGTPRVVVDTSGDVDVAAVAFRTRTLLPA